MRYYPFFLFDFLLIVFVSFLVAFALLHNTTPNYALAVASLAGFGVLVIGNQGKVQSFEAAVKGIKGIRDWESRFLSVGTLRLDYKGEGIRYSSSIRQRLNGAIPVDYSIRMANGSKASFEIKQKAGKLSMDGNKKLLSALKKEVAAFNRKYRLKRMKNGKGRLRVDVRLEFTADDMRKGMASGFLRDYLEFGHKINQRLKKRR